MPLSPSGIPFEELEDSPRIGITADGVLAVRKLLVPWDQWDALAVELYGLYRDVAGTVEFTVPMPFPGDRPNLVVDAIDVEPFEPGNPDSRHVTTLTGGANRYGAALLTVTYRQRFQHGKDNVQNPDVPPGTFLTYSAEFISERKTVDSMNWRWAGTTINVPGSTAISLVAIIGQHTLTWHRVARPPYEAIRTLRGKVNDDTFLGADAGTLLFGGARMTRQFQMRDEVPLWRIQYTFSEKRQDGLAYGWNHFFRKDTDPHWAAIETADAPHDPPYASGDFTTLFQLG